MSEGTGGKPSYRELAKQLGVSHNTVKLALKGEKGVSERTRSKILLAARLAGFFEDARISSDVIALVPVGCQAEKAAGMILDWLFVHDCPVRQVSTLREIESFFPKNEQEGAPVLLIFGGHELKGLRAFFGKARLVSFFTDLDGDSDTICFESVASLDSSRLRRPDSFLRVEQLEWIARRIADLKSFSAEGSARILFCKPGCSPDDPTFIYDGTPLVDSLAQPSMEVIAAAVGKTTATVSMALQGDCRISAETRREVVKKSWSLGFRGFHRKKSKHILVFDQWTMKPEHIFRSFYNTLDQMAEEDGKLSFSHLTSASLEVIGRSVYNIQPDGIIFFYDDQAILARVRSVMDPDICPAVSLMSPLYRDGVDSVLEDNRMGIADLITHFEARGLKRFSFLSTVFSSGHAYQERKEAFDEMIRDRGLKHEKSWDLSFSPDQTREMAGGTPERFVPALTREIQKRMDAGNTPPDVILCYNDELALALSLTLDSLNIRNIQIGGWGGQDLLNRARHPVVTVDCALDLLARSALELIDLRIEYPYVAPRVVRCRKPLKRVAFEGDL